MEFNDYLKQDYNDLVKAANKITGNSELSYDLLHYAIEEMSFKSNIQDIIDSGGARFYCVRIMMTQWRSKTGPFYKQYIKSGEQIEHHDVEEKEEKVLDVDKVNNILEELTWYDRELFKLYAEGEHNYSSLAKETGIPRTSIGLTINRVKKYIKQNL